MSKTGKQLLGLATILPFGYIIFFFVAIFSAFLFESTGLIAVIFPLHILMMLLITALTVFYIVDIFRNNRVDKDKKALWAIVIFMGSIIAMPIYWYMYFWKEQPAADAPLPAQLGSANSAAWTNDARAQQPQQEYVPPSQPPDWR